VCPEGLVVWLRQSWRWSLYRQRRRRRRAPGWRGINTHRPHLAPPPPHGGPLPLPQVDWHHFKDAWPFVQAQVQATLDYIEKQVPTAESSGSFTEQPTELDAGAAR
jgi:hypothetical protein